VSRDCSNITGQPRPDFALVSTALPVFARLLEHMVDAEVLSNVCTTLCALADDCTSDSQQIQAVIDSGVTGRLVELLTHKDSTVRTSALRTVGNLITGSEAHTQAVLDCGVLQHLRTLLRHSDQAVRREACWTLSNICAGTEKQVAAVFAADIIPPLLAIMQFDEWAVQKEAAWAIINVATDCGLDAQVLYMVQKGAIPRLCALFARCPESELLTAGLKAMERILRIGREDGVSEAAGTEATSSVPAAAASAVIPPASSAHSVPPNPYVEEVLQCGGLLGLLQLEDRTDSDDEFATVVQRILAFFPDTALEEARAEKNKATDEQQK